MRILEFTVPEQFDQARGNVFLRSFCRLSHRTILALKQVENGVTADGKLLRVIDRVRTGQKVVIRLPEEHHVMQQAVSLPVLVVYEDEDLLVFNKPADMPIHPSAGHADDTLANAAAAYLSAKGECCAFRPVNRLDRNTSGLAVTAKHAHAAARLNGHVEKIYLAVTQGIPPASGTIDAPLRTMEGHGIRREIGDGGESAITHWRTLETGEDHALLRVVIATGRTHQIRAHFSCSGYPLAGDDMYGGHLTLIARHALHCAAVRFLHPVTNQPMELLAPLPEDMVRLLHLCGMEAPLPEALLPFGL